MWGRLEPRPAVLLLADATTAEALRTHLPEATFAASLAELAGHLARRPWDVLLVDAALPGLGRPLPPALCDTTCVVLLLDDDRPAVPAGASALWLPRALALAQPALLQAGLDQAAALLALTRRLASTEARLREAGDQMETLLRLLGSAGGAAGPRWHTQRVVLERLGEEVARIARHGGLLSVVVAEVVPPGEAPPPLAAVAEQLAQGKRACDVLGQYGPHGFLLLLPETDQKGARECCTRLAGLLRGRADWGFAYGVATYSPPASATNLLHRAEEDLERSRGG